MLGIGQLAKLVSQSFGVVLIAACVCASAAVPTVVITNLPAYGTTNNLGGIIVNASPAACRVAVFIYVPGYGWVTKPTCGQPLTLINSNGSWNADITTGGSDQLATRIARPLGHEMLLNAVFNMDGIIIIPSVSRDGAAHQHFIERRRKPFLACARDFEKTICNHQPDGHSQRPPARPEA